MTTIQAAIVWTLVAVASIVSAQACGTQHLTFNDSEGTTVVIYN